jgi:hypothetical protein
MDQRCASSGSKLAVLAGWCTTIPCQPLKNSGLNHAKTKRLSVLNEEKDATVLLVYFTAVKPVAR